MKKLFHAVLGSGSCGNSYVFYDGETSIIIDQGYSFVQFKKKFLSLDIPMKSIEAMFITHFHPDHCHGIKTTSTKLNIPMYIPKNAMEKEPVVLERLRLPEKKIKEVELDKEIKIGKFIVKAFATHHDSGGSVGYFIENEGEKITLISDTGHTDDIMESYARESSILFLEANYDDDLLLNGSYPYKLKKRVRGKWGHLSNTQSIDFVKDSGFNGNYLYLIHLSDKNNNVDFVQNLFKDSLSSLDTNIIVCPRGKVVNVMENE
jgi:phosphoribosyl 1,2-cyclic phosphodiesterase